MQQDETALVKEALRHAREALAKGARISPAAYMLVRCNPQTGALLTHPTAIGMAQEKPFESPADYLEFLSTLRAEARRLQAIAVAIGGEAQAEIEGQAKPRRVFYLRIEDADGVHQLHAPIERSASGWEQLGELVDAGDAADDLPEPLLPRASH
jgi:hypothetical protein